MGHGVQKSNSAGSDHQLYAEPVGRDNWLQQWVTDGHVAVISHGCREKALDGHKEPKEPLLQGAAQERNGFPFSEEVSEHLGANHGWKADIHKGQVTEKEAHRCVQAGIHPDEGNHAQVSRRGNKVKKKEEQEEEALRMRMALKACENKLRDPGIVFTSHWLLQSLEWGKKKRKKLIVHKALNSLKA